MALERFRPPFGAEVEPEPSLAERSEENLNFRLLAIEKVIEYRSLIERIKKYKLGDDPSIQKFVKYSVAKLKADRDRRAERNLEKKDELRDWLERNNFQKMSQIKSRGNVYYFCGPPFSNKASAERYLDEIWRDAKKSKIHFYYLVASYRESGFFFTSKKYLSIAPSGLIGSFDKHKKQLDQVDTR